VQVKQTWWLWNLWNCAGQTNMIYEVSGHVQVKHTWLLWSLWTCAGRTNMIASYEVSGPVQGKQRWGLYHHGHSNYKTSVGLAPGYPLWIRMWPCSVFTHGPAEPRGSLGQEAQRSVLSSPECSNRHWLTHIWCFHLTRFSLTIPSLAAKKAKMWDRKCFSSGFSLFQWAKSFDRSTFWKEPVGRGK
jgi:hypothetical protein